MTRVTFMITLDSPVEAASPGLAHLRSEDQGSDSLCLSTVFLWRTGNKLVSIITQITELTIFCPLCHCVGWLSGWPPVIMTFDKLPINNRVICNSRLFGGPRQSALGTRLQLRPRCEGQRCGPSECWLGFRWFETFRRKIIPWSEAQSWFWDGQSWEWSPKRHPSPLIRIRSFCKEQICGINLHFTFLVTGLGVVSCHSFGLCPVHNCPVLAVTQVLRVIMKRVHSVLWISFEIK